MREDALEDRPILNKKGVTLIELLVVLVICGVVIGGIYKVFIAQTRTYAVQDQMAEIQQDVRGAMEIIVRDLRMAGFQDRSFGSATISNTPIIPDNSNSKITVNYEYISSSTGATSTNTVIYDLPLAGGSLTRTLNGAQEPLLDNVANLNFSYGIDANGDGIIDGIDPVTGVIPDNAFVSGSVVGIAKVLAIRVTLTANPVSVDPNVTKIISPRTLTSVVTPRNMFFQRYRAY
jgi:prepilin-type N-terminal cleavage/methylation domain-containing protein